MILSVFSFAPLAVSAAPLVLLSDGAGNTYQKIYRALGSEPETPDCSHPEFGPHITEEQDPEIKQSVFVFHAHVHRDDDRCQTAIYQRVEIKTRGDKKSPEYVKGRYGESVSFRWRFRLSEGFLASDSFTHLHQIKAYDGDSYHPVLTLTARRPNFLEVQHVGSDGKKTILKSWPLLNSLLGEWVEAEEEITYGSRGSYSLRLSRVRDGSELLSFGRENLDLWRNGTSVMRPKWGIFRSLEFPDQLRDEDVRFAGFCLAKGADRCSRGAITIP